MSGKKKTKYKTTQVPMYSPSIMNSVFSFLESDFDNSNINIEINKTSARASSNLLNWHITYGEIIVK